jgi:N-hydroxyarylamine O-acetyltransferase
MVDLDAYFARIGYGGSRAATADTLAAIVDHHMDAIPFENLDVLLGRGISLDLAALQAKLVTARRGGYCFEHCTLVASVLEQLGFAITRHSARVTMRTPRTAAPRTHMFLTVELPGGTVMIDPGFGGDAPRVPIAIGGRAGEHSFERDGDLYVLRLAGQELWVSTLERDHPVDFEMANHFTYTHASSPFTQRILMQAWVSGGKATIMNRDASYLGERHQLADRAELRAFVARHFGADLPELEHVRVPSVPEWS